MTLAILEPVIRVFLYFPIFYNTLVMLYVLFSQYFSIIVILYHCLLLVSSQNLVAENFLCGTPLALTALYTDATTLFPLDISSTLHIWKSLCMSVRSVELCNTVNTSSVLIYYGLQNLSGFKMLALFAETIRL